LKPDNQKPKALPIEWATRLKNIAKNSGGEQYKEHRDQIEAKKGKGEGKEKGSRGGGGS